MPPGTGDVALSLSQTVPVAGAIVVTTPQQVSLADTRRAVRDVPEAEHPDARAHREHEPLRLPELPHESDIFGKAAARSWRRS
jgi:ATP-binding protein involved in chromosome partitioning